MMKRAQQNSYKGPFLWGTATSAHQVEGGNTNNDWWAFEQAGRVRESSGKACDQYSKYPDDIELIASLGHTAHRFSIEWSRIEPAEGKWDEDALSHYEDVLRRLAAKGIEPVVTLHHFTNPLWFSERGGWLQPEAVFYFTRYTNRIVERLGKYVRLWTTINEPMVYLYYGYCTGSWPPGHVSFREALCVMRHLVKAHVSAYRVIHHHADVILKRPVWVSIAKHLSVFDPCNPKSLRDRMVTRLRSYFFNQLILKALVRGFLFFPGLFCERLGSGPFLDFIGVNYYTRYFVTASGSAPSPLGFDCTKDHHTGYAGEINAMGWEVYPEGLSRTLETLRPYQLPVLICENGICTSDDEQRTNYIRRHLDVVQKAIDAGIDIIGYLYWSLLDNFEWAEGFGPRFGIVEVDYSSQKRKLRPSAHVLSELCRNIRHKSLYTP